jgi:hypothetical protein
LTTIAPIVIDKHELHSVWPLYQQPETRQLAQDGVTLVIERGSTCYGPGDRISVLATLKSEAAQASILRGFEFALREATVFRPGSGTGKKAAPQVRVVIVGEQKVPVNATLYGGDEHRAELSCVIPSQHTTTTLASARHIDITYTVSVKALMGTGKPVQIDLPIVVSNWPRVVSIEAIRRIGPTPNLSLLGPNGMPPPNSAAFSPRTTQFNTIAGPSGGMSNGVEPERRFSTMPTPQANGFPQQQQPQRATSPRVDEFGRNSVVAPAPQPRPAVASPPASHRFTVHNFADDEIPPSSTDSLLRRPSASGEKSSFQQQQGQSSQWISAEEEKRQLYARAKADVSRTQGMESPELVQQQQSASSPSSRTAWPTAEDEKLRLYNLARAKADRTQKTAGSVHSRSDSMSSQRAPAGASINHDAAMSPGAALYHQAMAAVQRNASMSGGHASGSAGGSSKPEPPAPSARFVPVRGVAPNYPSADEEKAMLQRYHNARAAVERVQDDPYSADEPVGEPMPYDSLYPTSAGPGSPPPHSSIPSPSLSRVASGSASHAPTNAYDEKMRMRQHFETQDQGLNMPQPQPYIQAASSNMNGWAQSPSSPPPPGGPSGAYSSSAEAEKERLRRKFEQDDAGGSGYGATPQPPPRRTPSYTPANSRPPPPAPPMSAPLGGSFIPTNAAEEKARLRAQYEAQDQGASMPTPPPLMPRPPPGYIQEVDEDDSLYQDNSVYQNGHHGNGYANGNGNNHQEGTSTFGPGQPKPPLPPKPFQ